MLHYFFLNFVGHLGLTIWIEYKDTRCRESASTICILANFLSDSATVDCKCGDHLSVTPLGILPKKN